MNMGYGTKYLSLGEDIDPEQYVICEYWAESTLPIEEAASAIAAEQSTGTWTDVSTFTDDIFKSYGGKVIEVVPETAHKGSLKIAFPNDDMSVEVGGVPQILSVIAGNLFGLEDLVNVRINDVQFPKAIVEKFRGPKFGLRGLKELLDMPPERPLIGTIVKPKIGLGPKEFANYVYEGGMGGLTNSKDDETLTNQPFCPIEDRTRTVAEAIDKVYDESGHKLVHAINVSTRSDEIVELAEKAQEWGARQIMIDVLTCGYTALQSLAEDPSIKLPIHVHRTMHGAFTRNPLHGISMTVVSKLVRLCGGDALHIGTFGVGKMHGTPDEDLKYQRALIDEMYGLKTLMPVSSGGMYPGAIPALMKVAGGDLQIQAGGGVSGHPQGVRAGAMAMSQAVDAVLNETSLEEYAQDHEELKLAIEKWGEINV
jgi:ribulose-bisphosphate carboxylase large chain